MVKIQLIFLSLLTRHAAVMSCYIILEQHPFRVVTRLGKTQLSSMQHKSSVNNITAFNWCFGKDGGTSCKSQYGEAPSERGTFSVFRYIKGVKANERVGKSAIKL